MRDNYLEWNQAIKGSNNSVSDNNSHLRTNISTDITFPLNSNVTKISIDLKSLNKTLKRLETDFV
ncbi:MAG: hypothetical protein PHP79_08530, partial [Clostridia bacterium]|nr:hypothetical protein [Clostridia bacterium]